MSDEEALRIGREQAAEPSGLSPSGFERTPWLHLRGQLTYHAEAHVVGTRAGLVALRNAIDAALNKREAEAAVFANDGEGYIITVRRAASCRQMGEPPYLDELARELAGYERKWAVKIMRQKWRAGR